MSLGVTKQTRNPARRAAQNNKTMSYTHLLCHIIIRTKRSEMTIPNEQSEKLYRYIWGFVKGKKSVLYRINGMPDHIHLFVRLHPTVAVSEFVKTLKNSTNNWLKTNKEDFPDFVSWSRKYCALTYSEREKDMIINYIINQREHHKRENTENELRRLLAENGVDIDEKYWNED